MLENSLENSISKNVINNLKHVQINRDYTGGDDKQNASQSTPKKGWAIVVAALVTAIGAIIVAIIQSGN